MSTEEVLMDESIPDTMQENSSDSDMLHQTTPDQATPEKMMETGTPETMMEKSTPEAMMDDSMAMPGWFSAPLTDVRSGEQFTISDLEGKVVLVETMAMWCSNCLKQQKQVLELHSLLGDRDDFVSLGLDIDPNEVGEALQAYTETNGFYWMYAISPAEVSREIGQLYGDQFLNPPSTPMLIIDRHGQAHPLPFGIKNAQSLMEALQPFLEEGI
jgi:thiol-disulfide isomerase/thioredoxin